MAFPRFIFAGLLNTGQIYLIYLGLLRIMLYPLACGLNYLIGITFLWLLVSMLHVPKEIAPLIVIAVTVPFIYVLTEKIFTERF